MTVTPPHIANRPHLTRQNAQKGSGTNLQQSVEHHAVDKIYLPESTPKTAKPRQTVGSKLIQAPVSLALRLTPKSILRSVEDRFLYPGARQNGANASCNLLAAKSKIKRLSPAYKPDIERVREVGFTSATKGQTVRHKAWFAPPRHGKPTILLSGPNMGSLEDMFSLLPLMRSGYGVLAYEYPGYGKTTGKPGEKALYASVEAASDYLAREQHIPVEEQVAYGVSLGGAVTTDIAAKRPFKAVILDSTFTSFPDVVKSQLGEFLPSWLGGLPKVVPSQFNSLEKIQNIQSPLLILHANQDPLLSVQFAKALYRQADSTDKKMLILKDKGHPLPSNKITPHMRAFLDGLPD